MIDIIEKKKHKKELSDPEIQFFINEYLLDHIPDYQISALLMAIWFNGMTEREINVLTMAMAESGSILDLSSISGIKVDKHSTGGVGDKTTLALLPMVAAAGVPVPKISGRGLGHTGGTIDKLESITDFKTNLSVHRFIEIVKMTNTAIISTNIDLAPADKKLYALRDVTGTIDSIPLIASSIMSKKIAGGADAFVLNVTVGKGAFIRRFSDAVSLGEIMVNIGKNNHKNTHVIISSMDQPLGHAIGNSLEVREAIHLLNNQGPDDLKEICLYLGSYMLIAGGIVQQPQEGMIKLTQVLEDGSALHKLMDMVKAQNGDTRQIKNPDLLPKARYQENIISDKKGYISKIDARLIGEASMLLGAGRKKKGDLIDLAVGMILKKKSGHQLEAGEAVATVYFNDQEKFKIAKELIQNAFVISEKEPDKFPLILAVINRDGIVKF